MKKASKDEVLFEIYQELGECYTHTGNIEKAVQHFEMAIKLGPVSERPYIGMGVALLQQNSADEAKNISKMPLHEIATVTLPFPDWPWQ